jgi:hypothetical protein
MSSGCDAFRRINNNNANNKKMKGARCPEGSPVEDAGAEGDSRKQREEEQKQNNKNILSCAAY